MFTNRPAMRKEPYQEATTGQARTPELERDFQLIRDAVQQKLLSNDNGGRSLERDTDKLRSRLEDNFNAVLEEENILYNHATRTQMLQWVAADITGYGPIEPLLADDDITEIMVNGYDKVYVERFGVIEPTNVKFEDTAHLMRVIDRIVSPIGRRIDESSPMVDARLPSGYRVNATIPPLSLDGPILTIRKFATRPFTVQDLISNGTLTVALASFLKSCVEARVNVVNSGGTGTGKTTFLNVLSSFIPEAERVITIEDTAELQMKQPHVVRLEKRPPNIEGKGEIAIRQLVINALRMRPDRIIVGECRGGEALDMLQAMNTGHDGSMTTIHSNGPRDALRRIETMVLMAGMELPLKAIREQVSSAIELVVHLERLKDGSRKIVNVSEVQGMEGDTIVMQDLFVFQYADFKNGRVQGKLVPTGLRPRFLEKFTANGIDMPDSIFEK
ncbi:MAG TPA: type II secretion system protein E [Anaerolineaceae bacterium]|nr:type II secretion system protein E [Anaerolineaceae bacterium]